MMLERHVYPETVLPSRACLAAHHQREAAEAYDLWDVSEVRLPPLNDLWSACIVGLLLPSRRPE